jgi:hypothetical protein
LADFYWTALVTVLNVALPYAITRFDRTRLSAPELARAWNTSSWACAVYFFGPLCLPAHFFVTRRTLTGFLLGTACTAAVFAVEWLAGTAIDAVIG